MRIRTLENSDDDPKYIPPRTLRINRVFVGLFLLGLLFGSWYAYRGYKTAVAAEANGVVISTQDIKITESTKTPPPTSSPTTTRTAAIDGGGAFSSLTGFRTTQTQTPGVTTETALPPGVIVITQIVTQTVVVSGGGGGGVIKQTVIVPKPIVVKQTVIVPVTVIAPQPTTTPAPTTVPTIVPTTAPDMYYLYLPVVMSTRARIAELVSPIENNPYPPPVEKNQ